MINLSVCIIAQNEEKNIERCLKSVQWAAELIVVDGGSTDQTPELAKQLGAKVIHNPWPGWAKQKNVAIENASNDWVLSLDADEWLLPEAEKVIHNAIDQDTIDSYRLRRQAYFLGRFIAHAGWYPDAQVRLFRKSRTKFREVPVHEKVEETAQTSDLNLDIQHQPYSGIAQYIEKSNRYTSVQADQQKEQNWLLLKILLKPWYRFFQLYIFKGGFLDGFPGFAITVLSMWYEFCVLAKIWELRHG